MKTKTSSCLLTFISISLITIFFSACSKKADQTLPVDDNTNVVLNKSANLQMLSFRGIRISDPGGHLALDNPERGFRSEYALKASDLHNPFHGTNHSGGILQLLNDDETNFGNNKLRVVQIYFYLTDYLNTSISSTAFQNMQLIFDQCDQLGIKVLLRFAYRYADNSPYETLNDITNHLAQLNAFLQTNKEKIFVIQAGILGLWGEWHHSLYDNSTGAKGYVIRKLLENIPAGMKIQVRETAFKTQAIANFNGYIGNYGGTWGANVTYDMINTANAARIGFHNDYFVLDQGPDAHWDYRWPDQDFFQVVDEGGYTAVDGEMPYNGVGDGYFNIIAYGNLGGWYAARRMRAHYYSSFSIAHNYTLNIAAWKTHLLSPQQFRDDNIPVTDDYFLNANGQEISRIAFEYIRDHLGYRLQLRAASIPMSVTPVSTFTLNCEIKNFGFSRMINYHPFYYVLIGPDDQVHEFLCTSLSADQIAPTYDQSVYSINQQISINNLPTGNYRVGIWIPDGSDDFKYNPKYAVRLANANVQWWTDPQSKYLINIIGNVMVQ